MIGVHGLNLVVMLNESCGARVGKKHIVSSHLTFRNLYCKYECKTGKVRNYVTHQEIREGCRRTGLGGSIKRDIQGMGGMVDVTHFCETDIRRREASKF